MRVEFCREAQLASTRVAASNVVAANKYAEESGTGFDMTNPQSSSYRGQRQMLRRILAVVTAVFIAGFTVIPAQAFQAEHPLTGRHIAPVMGAGGADWLERNEREMEENPD